MKVNLIAIIFHLAFSTIAFGQIYSPQKPVAIGLNISQYQKDFGIGVHMISPYFAQSKVAIRIGGNLQWFEHQNGAETVWTPYKNVQLGIRYRQLVFEDLISIYSEGGCLLLIPNGNFSSKSHLLGGYGLLGFEIKPINSPEYFMELGGLSTGATADKITANPIYSNGFLVNAGFRINI